MALIKHGKTEDGKYQMTATVDADAFNKAVDRVFQRENKKLNIQGFRKGKAPRGIVERMYGEDFFFNDAINDLWYDVFESAINEANIEFVGKPDIEVPEVGKNLGATFVFTVVLRPELSVGKYKGIAGTKHVHTVGDDAVDAKIEEARKRGARMVTVEDRAATDGDTAVIDFEGFLDGTPFEGGKGENYDLKLGAGAFIPGFEEQVAGHKPGEEFDITVTFPEDYGAEELAGKETIFKIKLHELRFEELPELDDELAKDMSEFETLEAWKADIRKQLEEHEETHAKENLETELVEAVAGTLEGDIPDEMIEDRIDESVRDFESRLKQQGLDMQSYLKYTNSTMADFRNSQKEQAEKAVRNRLALEAVARIEKIEVSEEEYEQKVNEMAELYKLEAEKIKELVPKKELFADLRVQKAIDFIVDNAKVKNEICEHEHHEH